MCPKQLCYRFFNRDEFALEGELDYRLVQASALAANPDTNRTNQSLMSDISQRTKGFQSLFNAFIETIRDYVLSHVKNSFFNII